MLFSDDALKFSSLKKLNEQQQALTARKQEILDTLAGVREAAAKAVANRSSACKAVEARQKEVRPHGGLCKGSVSLAPAFGHKAPSRDEGVLGHFLVLFVDVIWSSFLADFVGRCPTRISAVHPHLQVDGAKLDSVAAAEAAVAGVQQRQQESSGTGTSYDARFGPQDQAMTKAITKCLQVLTRSPSLPHPCS